MIFIINFTINIGRLKNYSFLHLFIHSSYNVPNGIIEITPFIYLLSCFISLRILSINNELVFLKSIGLSIWKILIPYLYIGIVGGLIVITVLSSISSSLLTSLHINDHDDVIYLYPKKNYVWINDKHANYSNIIAATKVTIQDNSIKLSNIKFLEIQNDKFKSIIFAQNAIIKDFMITFHNAIYKKSNTLYSTLETEIIKTSSLNKDNILVLDSSPNLVKIWDMTKVISSMKKLSLNTNTFEIYFYNLLTLPLMLISMILLGATLAIDNRRESNTFNALIICAFIGLTANFFLVFGNVALTSFNINAFISTLIIKIMILLLSLNLLLKKEGL